MLEELKKKCENLMTFMSSNLYIHSDESDETIQVSKLNIPEFLSNYTEDSIKYIMRGKRKLTSEAVDHQAYLFIDPFKMCYLICPLQSKDNRHYTITLGPLINEHLTAEEIRYLGYKMKLSSDNCFILESFYGIVPYYDSEQLERIASVFMDYLSVESHQPTIIRKDHSILLPEQSKVIENKFESFDYIKNNYSAEAMLLKAIEMGDLDSINKFINTFASTTLPPRFPSDPLREQKNLSITLNSICVRAALKGGLNQSIAHNLSHNFGIQIEQQTSTDALVALDVNIIRTYTQSVRKYALKDQSALIINTVNYVRANLTGKVTLADVAEHLHVSREYLSRRFQEKMRVTLTDFIHQAKAEESCNLLTSNQYNISDIAYTFGYSSPAHYSKVFKKFIGVSPRQWQINSKENDSKL